jgi:hypothetical protein
VRAREAKEGLGTYSRGQKAFMPNYWYVVVSAVKSALTFMATAISKTRDFWQKVVLLEMEKGERGACKASLIAPFLFPLPFPRLMQKV